MNVKLWNTISRSTKNIIPTLCGWITNATFKSTQKSYHQFQLLKIYITFPYLVYSKFTTRLFHSNQKFRLFIYIIHILFDFHFVFSYLCFRFITFRANLWKTLHTHTYTYIHSSDWKQLIYSENYSQQNTYTPSQLQSQNIFFFKKKNASSLANSNWK